MSYADAVFKETCIQILNSGFSDENLPVRPKWEDGTPAHTKKIFGVVNRYDLQREFPLMTLRRTYWKSALDEILWIWQKKSNKVNELSSHIWDQWADDNGTIGRAYGFQAGLMYPVRGVELDKLRALLPNRRIETIQGVNSNRIICDLPFAAIHNKDSGITYMNQVDKALYDLMFNPTSRRIIITTWNPMDATKMNLEPCAYSVTFNVTGNRLNAILNQRSQDMLTASNWNVVQYSLLLMLFARTCGLVPGELVHVIADCHIYDRHIPLVEKLISNVGYSVPKMELNRDVRNFYDADATSFALDGAYKFHEFNDSIPVAI